MLKLGSYWPWKTVSRHFHMTVRPMLLHRMALASFHLFCKNLGNLQEFFGQIVYRPPLAQNCPYAYEVNYECSPIPGYSLKAPGSYWWPAFANGWLAQSLTLGTLDYILSQLVDNLPHLLWYSQLYLRLWDQQKQEVQRWKLSPPP